MKHIVKRNGKSEVFDERKLYASIYSSCLSAREQIVTAELIANQVCNDVKDWLTAKSEVSSNDIRAQAAKNLNKLNEHAALLYTHHRIM